MKGSIAESSELSTVACQTKPEPFLELESERGLRDRARSRSNIAEPELKSKMRQKKLYSLEKPWNTAS